MWVDVAAVEPLIVMEWRQAEERKRAAAADGEENTHETLAEESNIVIRTCSSFLLHFNHLMGEYLRKEGRNNKL